MNQQNTVLENPAGNLMSHILQLYSKIAFFLVIHVFVVRKTVSHFLVFFTNTSPVKIRKELKRS